MPSRRKTFRCVCVICSDNNPDGRDILLCELSAHLLRAKREGTLGSNASFMGTSIPRDTLPKESSPPMPPTLPGDCYLNSVPSLQSTPSWLVQRNAKRITLLGKLMPPLMLLSIAQMKFAIVDNGAGVQAIEENISVVRSAFGSVK